MIILDIDNPKTCDDCPLCVHDSSCVAQRKAKGKWRYVRSIISGLNYKDWTCPIMAEISAEEMKEKGIKLLKDYHGRLRSELT